MAKHSWEWLKALYILQNILQPWRKSLKQWVHRQFLQPHRHSSQWVHRVYKCTQWKESCWHVTTTCKHYQVGLLSFVAIVGNRQVWITSAMLTPYFYVNMKIIWCVHYSTFRYFSPHGHNFNCILASFKIQSISIVCNVAEVLVVTSNWHIHTACSLETATFIIC